MLGWSACFCETIPVSEQRAGSVWYMSEQTALAALRAAPQAVRLAESASSPYVSVRHGRREDRAAAYDRFVLACARCARARDGSGVEEVWAAWRAVNLRAPVQVRKAASKLAGITLSIAEPMGAGVKAKSAIALNKGTEASKGLAGEDVWLSELLSEFVVVARADLGRRWWKAPVWAWRDLMMWRREKRRKPELFEDALREVLRPTRNRA